MDENRREPEMCETEAGGGRGGTGMLKMQFVCWLLLLLFLGCCERSPPALTQKWPMFGARTELERGGGTTWGTLFPSHNSCAHLIWPPESQHIIPPLPFHILKSELVRDGEKNCEAKSRHTLCQKVALHWTGAALNNSWVTTTVLDWCLFTVGLSPVKAACRVTLLHCSY